MKIALVALFAVNAVILCLALWKAFTSDIDEVDLADQKTPALDSPISVTEKTVSPPHASIANENMQSSPPSLPSSSVPSPANPRQVSTHSTQTSSKILQPEKREEHCWMLGTFNSELLAEKAAGVLSKKSQQTNIINRSAEVVKNYWVHLPAMASREVAAKRNQELKLQNIDSFLVSSGERKNSISLGIFSTEARALLLQSNLRKKGVDAHIKPNMTSKPEFWLEVHGIPKGDWVEIESVVAPVFKAAQKKAQKMIQKPCEAVASFS